jgi:hypothetical protein
MSDFRLVFFKKTLNISFQFLLQENPEAASKTTNNKNNKNNKNGIHPSFPNCGLRGLNHNGLEYKYNGLQLSSHIIQQ